MTEDRPIWHETSAGIYCLAGDSVQFYDDWDHWQNGFCRLLEIADEEARNLVERTINLRNGRFAESSESEKLRAIKQAVADCFNVHDRLLNLDLTRCGTSFNGEPANIIYAYSISGNRDIMIAGNHDLEYAWQIDGATLEPVADAVEYDESYFDAPAKPHLGMVNYLKDEDWRMQKARRLLNTIISNAKRTFENAVALDVGAAASYFRMAIKESTSIQHYGLDKSAAAISISKSKFGLDTLHGAISELPSVARHLAGRCDLITLFDVIEHLDDPLASINTLKEFLSPNGILVIRTPNLVSLEYDLLGDYYYSFKIDHLKYFSPKSLNLLMESCSLKPVYLETTSHIFKGLLGMDAIHKQQLQNTGADILAIYLN